MRFILPLIFAATLFLFGSATDIPQNLVPNPSFENGNCPTTISQIYLAKSWSSANGGTPDYFKTCSPGNRVGVPENKDGYQHAADSNSYVGLYFVHNPDNREYIQCKLVKAMEKGKSYTISLKVSLSDESRYYLKHIDAAFTPDRIYAKGYSRIKCDTACIVHFSGDSTLSNTKDWILLNKNFLAKGGEQYLTIGWFFKDEMLLGLPGAQHNKKDVERAFYYIDEVRVLQE